MAARIGWLLVVILGASGCFAVRASRDAILGPPRYDSIERFVGCSVEEEARMPRVALTFRARGRDWRYTKTQQHGETLDEKLALPQSTRVCVLQPVDAATALDPTREILVTYERVSDDRAQFVVRVHLDGAVPVPWEFTLRGPERISHARRFAWSVVLPFAAIADIVAAPVQLVLLFVL